MDPTEHYKTSFYTKILILLKIWTLSDFSRQKNGAEGETRTRTSIRPLDPEPSASTSSATSAHLTIIRWRL